MKRREFLTLAAAATGSGLAACAGPISSQRFGRVMTVRGPIGPDEMGITLPHEHVLVDFAPAGEVGPHRYDPVEVVETALPYLQAAYGQGVRTLIDATPAYLGRDPLVLRALSERTGLHILTNTGYYGARNDVHLPPHVFEGTAEDLAERWIGEWLNGIGGTPIRPGFMKIGVDGSSLSEIDAKLVRAAALTHLETGLTIAAHTGPSVPAFEQLDLLAEFGVHPSAWIWVHAQGADDSDAHIAAARRGAWVELDGIRPDATDRYVDFVLKMSRAGLLHRVLLSQDAGWYSVGESGGGEFRGYGALMDTFIPALREAGLNTSAVDQLLVRNPAEAFRIRVRRRQV